MERYDAIIIGGGPAGLFCAITAGGPGRKVLLLEKKPSAGRKLLISGAGQCNITHDGEIRDFMGHFGDNGKFLKPALMNFTNRALQDFFAEREMPLTVNKHGKFFPESLEAQDVLDVLLDECRRRDVIIRYGDEVRAVERKSGVFRVVTRGGSSEARFMVIATGGQSYPGTGSTGDGYNMARRLGHTLARPRPALAPIHIRDNPLSDLARIAFQDMTISLFRGEKKLREMKGHLILARLGLSGPVVFNMSRYAEPGDVIKLSFVDPGEQEELRGWFMKALEERGSRTVKNILNERDIPERIITRVLELSGVSLDLKGGALTKKDRNRILENLIGLPLTVKDRGDFDIAMVTQGGVSLEGVDPKTMASRKVPGLFFAGEVLDVDGDTGGYNIQAAFSTGKLAGDIIAGSL
jgi:predicted Rossmann fold flavoprotein